MKNPVELKQILLPREDVNLHKWAVVACDQFTSAPEYWKQLETLCSGSPSTLRMILPEVFLGEHNTLLIQQIYTAMNTYLHSKILCEAGKMILCRRYLGENKLRTGIVASVDLDAYDYFRGSTSPIRATENTVLERIPPRTAIRKNAPLELPHVLMLMDDPAFTIEASIRLGDCLYDFPLNMGGGRIEGFAVANPDEVLGAFDRLFSEALKDSQIKLAVGDGNHSLAAAKAHWEELKPSLSEEERACHPARLALVEIVNIYDAGIEFFAIHRACFNVLDTKSFVEEFAKSLADSDAQSTVFARGEQMTIPLPSSAVEAVRRTDEFLERYAAAHPEVRIDYIHGEDSLRQLCDQPSTVGIVMPSMNKAELFSTVAQCGALPKKTFSMGHANQKRYYLEAAAIK